MTNYMLDTNVFNDIMDYKNLEAFIVARNRGATLFVTHIQFDEISMTKDLERRKKLGEIFTSIDCKNVITSGAISGLSRSGMCSTTDGVLIDRIRKGNLKRSGDALIGATSVSMGYVLVTNDKQLQHNIKSEGGSYVNSIEFLNCWNIHKN